MADELEIRPPWVEYAAYPPGDPFWRQTGEHWLKDVWEPYWQGLDAVAQADYLQRWQVPDFWARFYFDPEFRTWLEGVDD